MESQFSKNGNVESIELDTEMMNGIEYTCQNEATENKIKRDEKAELKKTESSSELLYDVDDTPPIVIIFLYGVQIVIVNICYCIVMAVMISDMICADYEFRSRLFSTICVLSGITTMVQTGLGARMPIFQGPSIVFILPYMVAKSDPRWGCPSNVQDVTNDTIHNTTSTTEQPDQLLRVWEAEWEKITGALMAAHALEILVGLSGVLLILVKVVRPITIGVVSILIAIYVHGILAQFASVHWGISFMCISLIVLFSQYINWVTFPVPGWTPKGGFAWTRFPLFELFPVLLSVIVGWLVSLIVTETGQFTDDPKSREYLARTDINGDNIRDSPVFRVPYPGQYGIHFDVEYFLIFWVSILTTVLESFGSYHQYALACNLPKPPVHAINRGIFIEGLGGLLAAACGMGCATTTYANNVGIICITKVGSRVVYIAGGFIILLLGLFAKVGAVLVSIPRPVLAGPIFVGIALMCGSSFGNFFLLDLNKPRNQSTIGLGILAGVVLPFWIVANQGLPTKAVDTGSDIADRFFNAILGVPFLVGGIVACFLDNTLPGGKEDHSGTTSTTIAADEDPASAGSKYDARIRLFDPPFIGNAIRRWRLAKYIPILPDPDLWENKSTNL